MRPHSPWQMAKKICTVCWAHHQYEPSKLSETHLYLFATLLKKNQYSYKDEPKEWEVWGERVSRSSYTDFCGIYTSYPAVSPCNGYLVVNPATPWNPERSALSVGLITSVGHPMLPKCRNGWHYFPVHCKYILHLCFLVSIQNNCFVFSFWPVSSHALQSRWSPMLCSILGAAPALIGGSEWLAPLTYSSWSLPGQPLNSGLPDCCVLW